MPELLCYPEARMRLNDGVSFRVAVCNISTLHFETTSPCLKLASPEFHDAQR